MEQGAPQSHIKHRLLSPVAFEGPLYVSSATITARKLTDANKWLIVQDHESLLSSSHMQAHPYNLLAIGEAAIVNVSYPSSRTPLSFPVPSSGVIS